MQFLFATHSKPQQIDKLKLKLKLASNIYFIFKEPPVLLSVSLSVFVCVCFRIHMVALYVFVGVLKTNVISTRLPLATTWLRLSIQLRLQRVTFSIACFQAALPVSLACHCLWQWQQQPQQHQQQLLALCCCFCCCSSCYCFPFLQPFLCAGIADGLWVLMFLRYVHCERGERGSRGEGDTHT